MAFLAKRALAGALLSGLCVACASVAGPDSDLLVEPIQIDAVDVLLQESFPVQASAHVQGIVGDGCSELLPPVQVRSGNQIALTIQRSRPRDAICTQIARLYDAVLRLDGSFPPGRYRLSVNSVVRDFTVD